MFKLQFRYVKDGTVSNWFTIWETPDGLDCAKYLAQNVTIEGPNPPKEYHMIYTPVDTPKKD